MGRKDAMAVVLEPNSVYNLISRTDASNNKLLVHVKLTDSCLRALEEYQSGEVLSRRKPTIKFSGFQGSISIPLSKSISGDENTAEFKLDCSVLQSAGMDCIQQPGGSQDIQTVGAITHKINVRATDDSYQMTQQRMKEVEEERKGISTKVINMPKKGSKKISKVLPAYKQQNSLNVLSAVKRQIKSGAGIKVSNGTSKSLRERVIHLLAVRPYKKPELISRLTKDGVKGKERNALTTILQQVAVMTDNQYRLLKHLYSEIQVETWPGYSETEKQVLRRKTEVNDSSLVTSSSSPLKNSEVNKQPVKKRICPSNAESSSKKQCVAHINKNNNIVMKESVNKSSGVDKSSKTSLNHSNKVSPPIKKEVVESSLSGNLENSLNDVNNLDSPEYMRKYKPITTYEQRCSYKSDFNAEYDIYKALKEKVDSISTQFTELQNKRQQYPEKSVERQSTDDQILELYEKIQKDTSWQQMKKQCQELHSKLSYIKGLIAAYDAAYDKSIANT